MSSFDTRLRAVAGNSSLCRLQRGVEREALRVTRKGELSQRPHPMALGSPLLHSSITTDFSEAQLELITRVHSDAYTCRDELRDIHKFVYQCIDEELLWPASMPCELGSETEIPIARYGNSNTARVKEIYRRGLGNRYGRIMQTISGIHYNFSIPSDLWQPLAATDGKEVSQSYRTASYLRLIRNFRKHVWLLIYLFGASPVVAESFLRGREHNLQTFGPRTRYVPFATSLRMGPLGYQSEAQADLFVNYNSLTEYAESLKPALLEPYAPYERIGVKTNDVYEQLGSALLQIEAEFYGTIRPKRLTEPGERALLALTRRGIEYVELRCVDIDPFDPLGISATTMQFLDLFLLHSLLTENDGEDENQSKLNLSNQLRTVHKGRLRDVRLAQADGRPRLRDWAMDLLEQCVQVARVLDDEQGGNDYEKAVELQTAKILDVSSTPAEKIEQRLRQENQSYTDFCLTLADEHRRVLTKHSLDSQKMDEFRDLAETSQQQQAAIEENESEALHDYLDRTLTMAELA